MQRPNPKAVTLNDILSTEGLSHALISNLPGGAAFVVDRDLRYLLAEGEALTIAGFKSEDLVGHTIFEVLPPELATSYEPMYRQALAGEPFEHEHHAHNHWYISRGTPLRSADGEVCAVLVVSFDISDRKRREANQAFLVEIGDDLSRLVTPDEIMQAVGVQLGEYLNPGACVFVDVDEERGEVTVYHGWNKEGVPSLKQTFRMVEYLTDEFTRASRAGEIFVVRDTATDARVDADAYARLNIGAWIGVPFHREERWTAFLSVTDIAPRDWRDDEIELVRNIADRVFPRIERARAEAELRESEQKYRSLFNSIDDGFCIIERVAGEPIDFRYIEVNPAFAMQTGISDVVGKTIREVLPGVPEAVYKIYENVLKTGEPFRSEIDVPSISLTLETYAFQTEDESRLAVIFKDISDRKRHDANLAFLAEVSHDLARLTNIDETMNVLGEKIGGYFDLSACVFAELSETAEIAVINYTWQLSYMPSFIGTYRMQDFVTPEVLQLCRAGEAVVIRDVFDDPLVDGEQYAALNIGSFLSIPLIRDGEWRFLIVIYHSEPYDWRDDEIELTHELANRIWTRLERARAEVALSRAAKMDAFRVKLSDALRSLSDAVEIQATVTRTTMNFFGADRCYYCEIIDGDVIIRRDASREDLPTVVGVYLLENFPIFKAMLDVGQPFVFQDVHTTNVLDENLRQTCLQLQIVAAINVPVIKQGEPVGILTITQSTPRNWTQFETDLAEEIADRTWATIERTRAEANLREAELQRVREQSAREQEQQRAESLAELDRTKTLFFSNISHEFRTPLTLSLAPLQDALSDSANPLPQAQQERLELVHRNSLRLLKLVNTVLDFSRIEAGRMEAVYEPTDLATFTTELSSVFRSAIERAGLQLIVDCPPLPEPVFVDREMWEKIVLNLLSNAFKYTFEGEITVRLHPADRDRVILQIQDTGTGIAPEHLPHLFERFYQIRGAIARTLEGSGIGLALVHELVLLHGGTIDVSSTVGQGTRFAIAIPFGTEHLQSDGLRRVVGDPITATRTLTSTAIGTAPYVQEVERWIPQDAGVQGCRGARESVETRSSDSETRIAPAARILLVDDNADMRDYLRRILSEHLEVEAVANGTAALAAAFDRVPDLILTDVMMPGLDGFGLLGALRADPRTREVPIILLSARAGVEAIVEGLEAGADDYLIKPFSAQELVSRINTNLQMVQLRGEALQEARSALRSKDEFISVVSHELNTPLVSILGWTRLLRSKPSNPIVLHKALDTIEHNAMLQAKLVQDLLDISRITVGKFRLNLEPVELKSIVETAIATVDRTAAEKGVNLVWQQTTADSVVVMGDRDRLGQVICNLLTNAIKFTPTSGRVTIELSVTNNDNQLNHPCVQISVSDTGIGIATNFLPYIFDRFRQARELDSSKGLGLGLAIARHIVELHHGKIYAESAGVGKGATFIVRLPIQT